MHLLHRTASRHVHTSPLRAKIWPHSGQSGAIVPELGALKPSHIIIGAGSAGCVLVRRSLPHCHFQAHRLSENPSNRVLLLEAGPSDRWWHWTIHMPAALMYNLRTWTFNWMYHTTAQSHLDNRVLYCPRGRVWGGSSSLNAMCYVRGHPLDYDRWHDEGANGWSFNNCLPYFKKAQTHELSQGECDPFRGHAGPLHVMQGPCTNPLHQAFIQSGIEAGLGYTPDMNGYKQEGLGPMDQTIHKGYRFSASRAYLWPILHRPNLHTSTGITVSRLLFDGPQCIGVELVRNLAFEPGKVDSSTREKIYCEDMVILAAGAINTPQLLMLSGVGPAQHILDMPGVGQNLQDHLEVYVQQKCTQPITLYNRSSWRFPHRMISTGLRWLRDQTGDGASSHLESGGFARSSQEVPHPDIQFHFLPSAVYDDGRTLPHCHSYQVHVGPMRSRSRGHIRLQNRDPRRPPLINPHYFSDPDDAVQFRACIRLSRELFAQKAFDPFRGGELAPGADCVTDSQLDAFVRATASSAYHPCSSCRMGPSSDSQSVVDPRTMDVHGFSGLKIVDASVMPSIVSGNLNAPVIMLAERAADLIQGKRMLPPENPEIWHPQRDTDQLADLQTQTRTK